MSEKTPKNLFAYFFFSFDFDVTSIDKSNAIITLCLAQTGLALSVKKTRYI